jgi:hypothetical protein
MSAGSRILIVSHYFPPEAGAPQARLSAPRAGNGFMVSSVVLGRAMRPVS